MSIDVLTFDTPDDRSCSIISCELNAVDDLLVAQGVNYKDITFTSIDPETLLQEELQDFSAGGL